jgi:hypothetical protein
VSTYDASISVYSIDYIRLDKVRRAVLAELPANTDISITVTENAETETSG